MHLSRLKATNTAAGAACRWTARGSTWWNNTRLTCSAREAVLKGFFRFHRLEQGKQQGLLQVSEAGGPGRQAVDGGVEVVDEAEVAEYLDVNAVLRDIPTGFEAPALEEKYFLVTGTGKYFKNVQYDPAHNGFHLLRRGLPDLVGAAQHPGQHVHPLGEHHHAFAAHLPQGTGKGAAVQVTGTGKYFKNVQYDPAANLGLVRLTQGGKNCFSSQSTSLAEHVSLVLFHQGEPRAVQRHAAHAAVFVPDLPEGRGLRLLTTSNW